MGRGYVLVGYSNYYNNQKEVLRGTVRGWNMVFGWIGSVGGGHVMDKHSDMSNTLEGGVR